MTLPATKIAMVEVSPYFAFSTRTIVAAVLAIGWLIKQRQGYAVFNRLKIEITISMLGTVIGFPLLTSVALQYTGPSHGALVVALVPIITAALSSWHFKNRRSNVFWLLAATGTATVLATVIFQNEIEWKFADSLLLASAILVSIGYVYGTKAAKEIGGISTISLSLIASIPIALPIFIYSFPKNIISLQVFLALLYLGLFSMFLGFIFWYKGLTEGPPEKVSLVQLLQLFLTFLFSNLFLGEAISPIMLVSAVIVVVCLGGTKVVK